MNFGAQLHQVASGRIFIRTAHPVADRAARSSNVTRPGDGLAMMGVIEVPKSMELERMHGVRLNSHLWMDAAHTRPRSYMDEAQINECDINFLLTGLDYAAGALPDSFEVFLRGTMLDHDQSHMRWAFIFAPLQQRLKALPRDGLYEFGQNIDGFRLVSDNNYPGNSFTGIHRATLWGPGGRLGFSTSMEPNGFPEWLSQERARTALKGDPDMRRFAAAMTEQMPEEHVYDAEYQARRDVLAAKVIRGLTPDEDAVEAASSVPLSTPPRRRAKP